jgi:hypothetical protein
MLAYTWPVLLTADHTFVERWIEGHNLAAAALGKPLLLEEFGNIATGGAANLTTLCDPLYRYASSVVLQWSWSCNSVLERVAAGCEEPHRHDT